MKGTTGKVLYWPHIKTLGVPRPSHVERLATWYFARRWPAVALVTFGVVVASAAVAAWIVL